MIRKTHLKLIHKIVWSFGKTTAIDHEELFAEACLAYCEAVNKFDHNKNTKFTTWCWLCIRNALIDFIKKENQYNEIKRNNDFILVIENTEYEFFTIPITNILSNKSIEITKIVTQIYDELENLKPKQARGKIFHRLKNDDWKSRSIWTSFKELKENVNKTELDSIII